MKRIVIALGGNALAEQGKPATAAAQLEVVEKTSNSVSFIFKTKITDKKGNVVANKGGIIQNLDEGDRYKNVELDTLYFYYDDFDLVPGKYKLEMVQTDLY